MTLNEFILETKELLEKGNHHFADAYQHAEQLVLRTLNISPTHLFLRNTEQVELKELEKLKTVRKRRLAGEPLQYILGFEYFYESCFEVGPGCLIPRKETEQIVDEVLSFSPASNLKVVELGAGSGNIGISTLLKRDNVEWHAFELNPESVVYAQKNALTLLPKNAAYHLHSGDFFQIASNFGPYDVVVSNPPYISFRDYEELAPEVKKEPALALKGGEDGLEIIRKLISVIPTILKSNGLFLSEIGSTQGISLSKELIQESRFWQILKDLDGHSRILKIVNCAKNSR